MSNAETTPGPEEHDRPREADPRIRREAEPGLPPPSDPVRPAHPTGPAMAAPMWPAPPHPAPSPAPPRGGRGRLAAGALAVALVAGAAGGIAGWAVNGGSPPPDTVVQSVSMEAGSGKTVAQIVDEVSPSVVTIVTDIAEGSGVVYSTDGHIVTNHHVVDGASGVEVRFSDGDIARAEVVATDATQDLAVLKADGADDLTPVSFGDSGAVQVGDVTVAIGSPLGLEGTVTQGIVSATDRSMNVSNDQRPRTGEGSGSTLTGLIQTDAAINSGNSGGALVNGDGELIGINTAIVSTNSGSVGLGFAIPSNTVQQVVEQLIENGSVEQGYLGVSLANTQGNGAMVVEVEPGSPADEAGLRAGDVITAVDGTEVATASELAARVQGTAGGTEVVITFTRDDSERTAEATLGSK